MANNNVNAEIVKKIIITAQLITETPLRIASGTNDGLTDIMVLEDKNHRKFIPATSMAGVLKRAVASAYGVKYGTQIEKLLFGSIDDDSSNQSMIIISDVMLEKADKVVRDGVAIDYVTHAGIDTQKYDYEVIERGAVGKLKMEITVRKALADSISSLKFKKMHDNLDYVDDMAATLADILCSGIRMGSMTAKGFGKVKAVASDVFFFNFTADKKAWQKYICKGELPQQGYKGNAVTMAKPKTSFVMSLDLAVKSSLLLGDYETAEGINIEHKDEEGFKKLSAVPMTSKNEYLIPGTSIKGVLRNRAMQIMMKLSGNEKTATEVVENIMGYSREQEDNKVESRQSHLFVDEVYIKQEDVLKKHAQTRNRIDKFTGGTMNTALFTEEPLWQQEKKVKAFTFNLEVVDCEPRDAGLMLLLLKDLYLGHVAFGGGKGIGRGVVEGCGARVSYKGIDFEFDDKAMLIGSETQLKQQILEKYVKLLVG